MTSLFNPETVYPDMANGVIVTKPWTFSAGINGTNTPGKCFYVDPRGNEYGYAREGNDGLSWLTPLRTIQEAVDKCVTKRGDIIYVGSAAEDKNADDTTDYRKIKENVVIFDKANVHIFAVPFRSQWSHQIRASDGARSGLSPTGTIRACALYATIASDSVAFIVMSRDVEIAGFTIDSGGGKVGMYIGDGSGMTLTGTDAEGEEGANSSGAWIHDNYFIGDGIGSAGAGIVLQGCGSDVLIENNMFEKCDGAGVYLGSGSEKTIERPTIRYNHFKNCVGYGVFAYNTATTVQALVHGNTFQDGSNTMTNPVLFNGDSPVDALASGNWLGCTNGIVLGASSWISANYRNTAGNAATYVDVD